MRRALWVFGLMLLVAGCRRTAGGPMAGATTAEGAVTQMLAAAKRQDIQAVGAVWGTAMAPVRDLVSREEHEKRVLIMLCHMRHDEYRILSNRAAEGGRMIYDVELKAGTVTVAAPFTTVKNEKSGRYFVENFNLQPLAPVCAAGAKP
ncbi:MAG: hypothetical protein IT357_07295 [Gemmatimonadaceae bacterium]|nr:hypothetical protein [Gemmatimonadaceae bacterium]